MAESSRVDPEVPLMEFPEQDVVEVDGPHPVGSFLQSDVVLFQGLREEELLRFEAERACIRDEAHQVMAGVLGVRQAARVRARRRVPDGSRRLLAECFMRPLVVVLSAEALEAALLAAAGAGTVRGWQYAPSPVRKWPLKSAVHTSFGPAVTSSGAPGCFQARRRRRRRTSPRRCKRSPAVLAAGSSSPERWSASHTSSLRGPQLGCCRRVSTIAAATAGAMRCGQRCGARLRSASPATPTSA